jgi:hypothetical protein
MNIPANEKPGKIKRFTDNYGALTLIFLVLFNVCANAQDTTHPRQQINSGPGFRWLGVESFYSLVPPRDTFKLSIKDTGAIAFKNGAYYQWNKIGNVLKWDSLRAKGGAGGGGVNQSIGSGTRLINDGTNQVKKLGTHRYIKKYDSTTTPGTIIPILDTANIFADLDATHPYQLPINPTYFDTTGGVLNPVLSAFPSGGGPTAWYPNIDSMKAHTTGNGGIANLSEYHTGDGYFSGGKFVYLAASTLTADDRVIVAPNSGVGRWVALPDDNGKIFTSKIGIYPSTTDRTSMLYTATKNAALLGGTIFFNLAGKYYITPAVTGGVQADFDNFKWDAISADSVTIVAITYSGHNRTMLGATNGTKKKGFSIQHLNFDNTQRFANHTFAAGNAIGDTTARIFYLDGFDAPVIRDCRLKGSTTAAVDIRNTTNALFDRIYGDSIGGNVFTNQYDTTVNHVTVAHSRSDYYGVRWPWDAAHSKRRNGADFWQGHGGTGGYIKLLYDTAVNGTLNAWEFEEGLGAGYGNEIAYCYLDGRGRNCMGMSPGGDGYDNITGGGVMQFNADIHHNKQVNIGPVVFSAADSATHFSPNLIEASVMNGTQFHDNIWMNNHIISGNTTKNVRFTNDIFLNDSGPRGLQGESIILEVGTSNLGTTDSSDIALDKCVIQARGGELVRTDGNTVCKIRRSY